MEVSSGSIIGFTIGALWKHQWHESTIGFPISQKPISPMGDNGHPMALPLEFPFGWMASDKKPIQPNGPAISPQIPPNVLHWVAIAPMGPPFSHWTPLVDKKSTNGCHWAPILTPSETIQPNGAAIWPSPQDSQFHRKFVFPAHPHTLCIDYIISRSL